MGAEERRQHHDDILAGGGLLEGHHLVAAAGVAHVPHLGLARLTGQVTHRAAVVGHLPGVRSRSERVTAGQLRQVR